MPLTSNNLPQELGRCSVEAGKYHIHIRNDLAMGHPTLARIWSLTTSLFVMIPKQLQDARNTSKELIRTLSSFSWNPYLM
ncbi:hypothetical protein PILCRDRAFT_827653 [Piloderma croceum F 1598]|uniref:Uncharacterized protein n=1 Tax=Piloderma croceum (strain F 1598) TaxID=765440 RepID=A0A0C3AMI8_PILCF|nr:hypothetical protein PILCRDRAFT_827653 [Piloderma croceum F 1598]